MNPSAARVAHRYVWSKADLAKSLTEAISQFRDQGDPKDVLKVLRDFYDVLGVQVTGTSSKIQGEWFYALGKVNQNKVLSTVRLVHGLGRALQTNPKDPDLVPALQQLVGLFKLVDGLSKDTKDDADEHGPWTLVKMPGVSGKAMSGAVKALDDATKLVTKKFRQVAYGKVFVSPRLSGAYTAAQYVASNDSMYLSLKARDTVGDVYAICHELGHRYFAKFWKDTAAKDQFRQLSTETAYETILYTADQKKALAKDLLSQVVARKKGKSPPPSKALDDYLGHFAEVDMLDLRDLVRSATTGGAPESRTLVEGFLRMGPDSVQTDKVVRPPLSVTPYGGTSWTENFAEAFAHYVMGKSLPDEIQRIMDSLT